MRSLYIVMSLVCFMMGCSNAGSNGGTEQPKAPPPQTKLDSPNLSCSGISPTGAALKIEAEITDIKPSESQPTQVLFGSAKTIVTINGKIEDSRSGLLTMINYLVNIGGYVSSVSIDALNTGIEWSLWTESDLKKHEFLLVRDQLVNGVHDRKEVGKVRCTFTWKEQ